MKPKIIMLLLAVTVLLAACSEYGKKVEVSANTEVYIKGEGVSEADAQKLGHYIDTTYKEMTNKKSFQITKDSGQYVIRMVVDEEKVKGSALDISFMALQFLLESQVFTGNKVKLVLTTDRFKDIKTFRSMKKE